MSSILVCRTKKSKGLHARVLVGLHTSRYRSAESMPSYMPQVARHMGRRGRGIWSLGWLEKKRFNDRAIGQILHNLDVGSVAAAMPDDECVRDYAAKRAILRQMEFLVHMPKQAIQALAYQMNFLLLPFGTRIFDAGDAPGTFYILLKGHVVVRRRVYDRLLKRYIDNPVRLLGPGDVIGAFELVRNSRMLHSYVANTDIKLLSLDAETFQRMLRHVFSHFWHNQGIPTTNACLLYSLKERQLFFALQLGMITNNGFVDVRHLKFDNVVGTLNAKFAILDKLELLNIDIEIFDLDTMDVELNVSDESAQGLLLNDILEAFMPRYKQQLAVNEVLSTEDGPHMVCADAKLAEHSNSASALVPLSNPKTAKRQLSCVDDADQRPGNAFKHFKCMIAGKNVRISPQMKSGMLNGCQGQLLLPQAMLQAKMHYVLTSPLNDYGYMVSIMRDSYHDSQIFGGGMEMACIFEVGNSLMLKSGSVEEADEHGKGKGSVLMQVFCVPRKWALRGVVSGMAT